MNGLMMDDYPLCIPAILRHALQFHGHKAIVSRRADKGLHRTTYTECLTRAAQLGAALRQLGMKEGDRVGTFCWNHSRHLECYYGIPVAGLVAHTLNIRLHADDVTYIANHAEDQAIVVDLSLWPVFEKFRDRLIAKHIIVIGDGQPVPPGTIDHDAFVASALGASTEFPDVDERSASGMCSTAGTTGKPKGTLYSHRATVLHTLGSRSGAHLARRSGTWSCRWFRCSTQVCGASPSSAR